MKKLVLLTISITLTNVSYASFPIDNESIKTLNQIDNTETMEEIYSNPMEILMYILGIGFLAAISFGLYWVVKKTISKFREGNRRKKTNLIIGVLLTALAFIIFWQWEPPIHS